MFALNRPDEALRLLMNGSKSETPFFFSRCCLGKSRAERPSVSEAKVKRDTTAISSHDCNKQVRHAGSGSRTERREGQESWMGDNTLDQRQKDESPLLHTLGRRREGVWKYKVQCWFCDGHMYKLNRWEMNSPLIEWLYHRSFEPNGWDSLHSRFHSVILGLVKKVWDPFLLDTKGFVEVIYALQVLLLMPARYLRSMVVQVLTMEWIPLSVSPRKKIAYVEQVATHVLQISNFHRFVMPCFLSSQNCRRRKMPFATFNV